MPRFIASVFVFAFLAAFAAAQQFVFQTGAIPGPVVWSEGVEAFDANGDGNLDVIFTNGVGFSSASGALAPTLLINQGPGAATLFADETSTRIPSGFTQQGKGLCTCDVDNDGDQDVVFANAFNTQPRILINNGSGVFTDQTTTRFPVLLLNSFGVNYGDVDNDGDLDLVFADMGGAAGGLARLFINNGSGVFTNTPSQMNAVAKMGAMQVNIVDMDNDFDQDVIIDGKSSGQQLYVNNGAGVFTLNASVLPAGSSSTYETDWCDLDNDNDIDGFYISYSGFSEGSAKNNLIGAGVFSFTGATTTISGQNGDDDNEVAFIDYDNDGFVDPLVASLGFSREKLYRNLGTMATSSLVFQSTAFTAITDSTLDLTIGDFDGDHDYDVITAQGESGNFLNRYYQNTGVADTTAPRIGRVTTTPAYVGISVIQNAGQRVRAWIQDSTYDNGHIYSTAAMNITTVKDGFTSQTVVPMRYVGGGMFRGVIQPAAAPTGLLGMTVTWSITATDGAGNQTTSPSQSFVICGGENYGFATSVNHLTIDTTPDVRYNQTFTVNITNADVNQLGAVLVSGAPDMFNALGGTVYVQNVGLQLLTIASDGTGLASLPVFVPNIPALAGFEFYIQGVIYEPAQPFSWGMTVGRRMLIGAP